MGKNVGLLTPRVTLARQLDELKWFLDQAGLVAPDAVLVHNLGSLHLVRTQSDIPMYADFSFNVLNRSSIEYLSRLGARQVTLSLEASFKTLKDLAGSACVPLECIIHGPIPGMYLEHCLMSMSLMNTTSHDPCRGPCRYLQCGLSDTLQQIHPIEVDQYCRTHLLFSKDLACLNYVADFVNTGVRTLRIEGQYYEKELVGALTALYADLIANPFQGINAARLKRLIAMSPRGFSLGAYPKGICEDASQPHTGPSPDAQPVLRDSSLRHSSAH